MTVAHLLASRVGLCVGCCGQATAGAIPHQAEGTESPVRLLLVLKLESVAKNLHPDVPVCNPKHLSKTSGLWKPGSCV